MNVIKKYLIFSTLTLSALGSTQELYFFFDVGDCNPGTKPNHLIADSSQHIMIDWHEGNYVPDSAKVFCLDTSFTVHSPWWIDLPDLSSGLFNISAAVYKNNTVSTIDTVFNVSPIPEVYAVLRKITDTVAHQFVIDVYNTSDASLVSEKFLVCFAEYELMDNTGKIKFSSGAGQHFNLSYLTKTPGKMPVSGDQIRLTYVRLWSKEINRSFAVFPNSTLTLF